MREFKIHNLETAPEESKPMLENYVKSFGMVPNLGGILAEAPGILNAYQQLHKLFEETTLNKEELTVVWQTINVEHNCVYCVPAHTGVAQMMNADPAVNEALRNQVEMPNEKLQALHEFTLALVRKRGNVSEEELKAFYAAGYEQRNVLEIILGLSQKVISNYTNHIAKTPVDKPFEKFAWEKK